VGEWIKVNLPWTRTDDTPEYTRVVAEGYDLNAQLQCSAEAAQLDEDLDTLKDAMERQLPVAPDGFRFEAMDAIKARAPLLEHRPCNDGWWQLLQERYPFDPAVLAVGRYWHARWLVDTWIEEMGAEQLAAQQARFQAAATANRLRSFGSHPACRPGVQVEIRLRDGRQGRYLLGDCNRNGGLCDDCAAFEKSETTVLRYRELVPASELGPVLEGEHE
jgi:hypothetical protein